jgi:hypothetical protein
MYTVILPLRPYLGNHLPSLPSLEKGIVRIDFFTEAKLFEDATFKAVKCFPAVIAQQIGEFAADIPDAVSFTVSLQTNRITNVWKYEGDLAEILTQWWKLSSCVLMPCLLPLVELMPGRLLFDWQRASIKAMTTALMAPPEHVHPLDIVHEQYDEDSKVTYFYSRDGHVTCGGRQVIDRVPVTTFINGCVLVDRSATGKKRSVLYALVDMMHQPPKPLINRFRTSSSAMVIVIPPHKIHAWKKDIMAVVPLEWRILYILTAKDLAAADFTSADLIIVSRTSLTILSTRSLHVSSLQFRIVVFDDVHTLVYEGDKKSDTIYLKRKTIIAKTLFCGDSNILLSSKDLNLTQGSNHIDTCLYLAGVFQNNVSIYPRPLSPGDMFLRDPENRKEVFGGSVQNFFLQEDQKMLNHAQFLTHHVLQPLSNFAEPNILKLVYDPTSGNIDHFRSIGVLASEINTINALAVANSHHFTSADIALTKTLAHVASQQAGTKVALFRGMHHRPFNSWESIKESLKETHDINLMYMFSPADDLKRKRKSMQDNTTKNVIFLGGDDTYAPRFPFVTHIIVPWEFARVGNSYWQRMYDKFVDYTTRYGAMVGQTTVIIKLSKM